MSEWHSNRYVRVGIGSFAVTVAVALVFPPATASAAATPPSPSQGAVSQPRPNVPDARQKTTPGPAAPSNPGPPQSAPSNSAPPPAAKPRPQRKDKPPDRSAHKASPQHRASAPQRPSRNKNNNRKDTSRKSSSSKKTRSQDSRPATGRAGSGGPQEAIAGVINGINNILNRLAGQQRTRTQKADTDRPRTRKQRRCERSGAGCLTIDPSPKKRKPKKLRPRVNKLDNPDVVDKAEEELRKWREANEQGQQDLRQKYADAYNGPGSAIVDWCARFVSYAYAQAGFPLPDWQQDAWDKSPSGFQLVRAGRDAAKEAGLYHPGTAGIEPGDIVIYNGVNHTGIAVSGVKPDGTVDTIEGNTGNSEIDRQTPAADISPDQPGSGDIEGYIRPPANTTPMAPRFGNRHGNPLPGR